MRIQAIRRSGTDVALTLNPKTPRLQEERIVFISTVLSRPETLPPAPAAQPAAGHRAGGEDVHLGFWRNPKRFNVAITRAKALLVVVGHPVLLLEVRHSSPAQDASFNASEGMAVTPNV